LKVRQANTPMATTMITAITVRMAESKSPYFAFQINAHSKS